MQDNDAEGAHLRIAGQCALPASGQSLALDQGPQIGLGHRPDAVRDLGKDGAEARSPAGWTSRKLVSKVPDLNPPPLDGVGHHSPDLTELMKIAHRAGGRASRRDIADLSCRKHHLRIFVVRYTRTNATSGRRRSEGTSTSAIVASGTLMRCTCSAAGPVMTLPGPAYSSAAISRWNVVGAPVRDR